MNRVINSKLKSIPTKIEHEFAITILSAIAKDDLEFIRDNDVNEKIYCTCEKYDICITSCCVILEKWNILSYLLSNDRIETLEYDYTSPNDINFYQCKWIDTFMECIKRNEVISEDCGKICLNHVLKHSNLKQIIEHCCKRNENLNLVKELINKIEQSVFISLKSDNLIEYLKVSIDSSTNRIGHYLINRLFHMNVEPRKMNTILNYSGEKDNRRIIHYISFMYRHDLKALLSLESKHIIVNKCIIHQVLLTLTTMLYKIGIHIATPIMELIIFYMLSPKYNIKLGAYNYTVMKISESIAKVFEARSER